MLCPLQIAFNYAKIQISGDVKVIYSSTNRKPEENDCDRVVTNPKVLTIDTYDEREFSSDVIYFKFETYYGCKAEIKPIFPNQTKKEDYLKKDKDEQED